MKMITTLDSLCLRYYKQGDEEELFQYTSDIESSKFLARKPHDCMLQTKEMLQKLSVPTGLDKLGKCIWVVASVSDQEPLGYLTLIEKGFSVELHVSIIRKHSGKGNATAAIRLASEYLLEDLKYEEVVSFTDVEHLAAQAAFQKAGFSVIREIKEYYVAPQQSGSKRDVFWLQCSA